MSASIAACLCAAYEEMDEEEACICGHLQDEHSRSGECQVGHTEPVVTRYTMRITGPQKVSAMNLRDLLGARMRENDGWVIQVHEVRR